jgi:DNA transformation protein
MAVSKEFVEHVLDLLSGLGPVTARPMFGGYDLYLEGRVFALLHHDTLYLKADEISRPDFEAAGLPQFRPHVKGKPFPMPYFEAPEDALEDADELCRWARRALEAAYRAEAKPKKGGGRP